MEEALHIAYANGVIREAPSGRLIAFYENGVLLIDGVVEPIRVMDLEMAMEIVAEHFPSRPSVWG